MDLRLSQEHLLGNKVVLAFEEEFTMAKATKWIKTFNQKKGLLLTLVDELPQTLFVVQFESRKPEKIKASLLATSSLIARLGDLCSCK